MIPPGRMGPQFLFHKKWNFIMYGFILLCKQFDKMLKLWHLEDSLASQGIQSLIIHYCTYILNMTPLSLFYLHIVANVKASEPKTLSELVWSLVVHRPSVCLSVSPFVRLSINFSHFVTSCYFFLEPLDQINKNLSCL